MNKPNITVRWGIEVFMLPLLFITLTGCSQKNSLPKDVSVQKPNEMIEDRFPEDAGTIFSNDDDQILLQNTKQKDVPPYSVAALLDKEIPGSNFTIEQVLDENEVYTRYYITYVSDGLTISGIMNVPKATASDPGPWPVLFLNHGYIDTRVYTNGRGLKREQDYFARNGYVVVHSDYRDHAQSDKNPVPRDELGESGYVNDVIGGIVALKALAPEFANLEQIGMLGHSVGGGVTMRSTVVRPEMMQVAVLYAPVSSDYLDNLLRWGLDLVDPSKLAQIQDDAGEWDSVEIAPYSPMTYFDRIQVPIMIHQGDQDEAVPVQWSRDTRDRLAEAGKDVTYHEYPGEAHEFGPDWTTFMERNVAFFDEHLRNK